ncbi:unnamed protein product [Moneuplotes crassus]|uniref:Cyclic nucleotide-binding domain-containing protein n=1 Tax=Euplotes crassus TaxID=5936 RepID=A0AAD2D0M6_EUPCR|nr:unnamed protein product [Moneuplotes crassus]
MEKIVEILKLTYRTKSDVDILLPLMKQIEFFKSSKISEQELGFICKKLNHLFVPEGKDVITYGEYGSEFYISLDGKVDVLIPKSKEEQKEEEKESKQSVTPQKAKSKAPVRRQMHLSAESGQVKRKSTKLDVSGDGKDKSDPRIFTNKEIPYNKVAQLPPGVGFGELALISKNSKRAATIRAATDCNFAVLEKQDYQQIYGKYEEKILNQKIDFLKSIPIFKHATRDSMKKLTPFLLEKEYKKGQFVFKEGDKIDNTDEHNPTSPSYTAKHKNMDIFLIRQGEFEISSKGLKLNAKKPSVSMNQPQSYTILGPGNFLNDSLIFQPATPSTCSTTEEFLNAKCISTKGLCYIIKFNELYKSIKKTNSLKLFEETAKHKIQHNEEVVKARIDFMAKCESYMHKLRANEQLISIFAKGKKGIQKLKNEQFFKKKFWRETIHFREDLEEEKEDVKDPQKGIFTANAFLEDCESGKFEGSTFNFSRRSQQRDIKTLKSISRPKTGNRTSMIQQPRHMKQLVKFLNSSINSTRETLANRNNNSASLQQTCYKDESLNKAKYKSRIIRKRSQIKSGFMIFNNMQSSITKAPSFNETSVENFTFIGSPGKNKINLTKSEFSPSNNREIKTPNHRISYAQRNLKKRIGYKRVISKSKILMKNIPTNTQIILERTKQRQKIKGQPMASQFKSTTRKKVRMHQKRKNSVSLIHSGCFQKGSLTRKESSEYSEITNNSRKKAKNVIASGQLIQMINSVLPVRKNPLIL